MTDGILISGAGIAGLVAAVAIRRQGMKVTVFERADELLEVGAGLQISPNGSRVLIELGLEPYLRGIVSETNGKEIRLWSTGQTWKLFDLGLRARDTYGAPYWFVHRGDLHRGVLQGAIDAGVNIRTGTESIAVAQSEGKVQLTLRGGEVVTGRALIGADGIHSVLRNQIAGKDAPQFTGIMAWRGFAPSARLPEHLRRNVGVNWVGPGRHVITYPIRAGELVNFVGVVESDSWRSESWTDRGEIAECAADFAGWHDDVQSIIQNLVTPFRWALLSRKPLLQCAAGSAVLIGDACHPTLPFLAQGANMAIEDAMIVARCLAHFDRPEDAFRAFEHLRTERTSTIVQRSAEQAARFHNPAYAEAATAADIIDSEWETKRVEARYDWLFRYDPITVPLPRESDLTALSRA